MKDLWIEPGLRRYAAKRNHTLPDGRNPIGNRTRMHRLIRTPNPSRMDFVVNLSLGLAAMLAVAFSLRAAFDFCARLDRIAQWCSSQDGLAVVSGSDQPGRNSFTNA